MSNLALVIGDDLLRAARIEALQEGASVNQIARQAIARCAGVAPKADDTVAQLRKLSERMSGVPLLADRRHGAVRPGRQALYEEAEAERGKPWPPGKS